MNNIFKSINYKDQRLQIMEKIMLRFRFIIPTLFILLNIIPALFAQDTLVLTLEKSVQIATEYNPALKIAQKELEKANAGVWEAYSHILPQLNLSGNFQHNWKIQQSTIPNFIKSMLGPAAPADMPDYVQIAFGLENTLVYGANVTQPLFLGGAGLSGIQASYAARRATKQNLELARQNLLYETVNAFYTCLLAQEMVNVQKQALSQAEANYDVVKKKYDVGMASGFDKMRAQVEVANLRPEEITARNALKSAFTRLRTLLGLEKETDIKISGEFVYREDDFSTQPLDELQERALTNRPEILALTEQKDISKEGISIARSNFLPKLFFQTDYSFMGMRNDLKFSRDDFSEGFYSAVSLQIPLFSGFSSLKQYQKAQIDYKIIIDSEKQARDGITAEVEIAYNQFIQAREKVLSAQETVELAQEALRLANLMYDEGANTQLDVINSRLALTQSRMNYVNSLYEYQIALYTIRKACGVLNETI
jgi:outer membrane protein